MNKTKIEYGDYHWPIITGCTNGPEICATRDKCWARMLHRRFKDSWGWGEHYNTNFRMKFNKDILKAPDSLRKPSRILVAFTGDIMCYPNKQTIRAVLAEVESLPQHQFLFLTKNPKRYAEFNPWPANAWLGVSITDAEELLEAAEAVDKVEARTIWASFEPLLGNPRPDKMWREKTGIFGWVVVGAQTGPNAKKPELEWVKDILYSASLVRLPVWLKNNLLALYPELPHRQELP